jgi:hypothetical protein
MHQRRAGSRIIARSVMPVTLAMSRFLPVVALVAACNQANIDVKPSPKDDYNHTKLLEAIGKFVVAGRTPPAYGELAKTVVELRPGMDKSVAAEAELKMIVLALAPVKTVQDKPMAEQVQTLALTVWPTLLAPKIEADALLVVPDPKAPQIPPKPGEDPNQYLLRLCVGPLATTCKHVVPEYQGDVIDALALRSATERVRISVSECLECSSEASDPGWKTAVSGWEELDRAAAQWTADVERRADPDNWPIAGNASDDDPGVPEAEFAARGDVIVNGHAYGPNQQRIAVLRELRGKGDVIALHVRPDSTLAQVRAVLVDARKAGATRVAVIAREPVYPYRRRVYWIADGTGLRANLRPSDTIQLLVHAIDEVAGPGTVARVD